MKILYFDTETTGLNADENAIIQFAGIIEKDGEVLSKIEVKMQPHKTAIISPESLEVHGYDLDDFKEFTSAENGYNQIIKWLDQYVDKYDKQDKLYVAGQNIEFDVKFLQSLFKLNGNNFYGSYFNYKKIDLLVIMPFLQSCGMFLDSANLKLETVYSKFFDKEFCAHDALEDIEATRDCIIKCKEFIRKEEENAK